MTIPEFEQELKALDPGLSIVPNPNRPQLCNIKLNGVDVCPIPAHEIREESDPNYVIAGPNGVLLRHKSRPEALANVHHILNFIKTKEGMEVFYGK